MTPSERLIERLKSECGLDIPDGSAIERTYAGRHQKAAGGWVWVLVTPYSRNLGSIETVTELLKSPQLDVSFDRGDTEIHGKP
jgi:hypothetical protein